MADRHPIDAGRGLRGRRRAVVGHHVGAGDRPRPCRRPREGVDRRRPSAHPRRGRTHPPHRKWQSALRDRPHDARWHGQRGRARSRSTRRPAPSPRSPSHPPDPGAAAGRETRPTTDPPPKNHPSGARRSRCKAPQEDRSEQAPRRELSTGRGNAADRPHGARPSKRLSSEGRARRGTSGALYLQSAPAGLNPLPRSASSKADGLCDVDDRVPRSGDSRTVSGPEGSSTQR